MHPRVCVHPVQASLRLVCGQRANIQGLASAFVWGCPSKFRSVRTAAAAWSSQIMSIRPAGVLPVPRVDTLLVSTRCLCLVSTPAAGLTTVGLRLTSADPTWFVEVQTVLRSQTHPGSMCCGGVVRARCSSMSAGEQVSSQGCHVPWTQPASATLKQYHDLVWCIAEPDWGRGHSRK